MDHIAGTGVDHIGEHPVDHIADSGVDHTCRLWVDHIGGSQVDQSRAARDNHDDESDRAAAKAFFEVFFAAFPDLRAEIHDQVAEGDKVVTRKTFHGTHKGEFYGIPASGRQINVEVIDILRVVDEKVTDHWSAMDMMGLMQQIGAAPDQA